jgi:hypothetical protein
MISYHRGKRQILKSFLRQLYPKVYSETYLAEVEDKVKSCTSALAFIRVLVRTEYPYTERMADAFNQKSKELNGASCQTPFLNLKPKTMRPLLKEVRKSIIDLIKDLLPFSTKHNPILPELQTAIDQCTTEEELTELLYSVDLNTEWEIDAFEKRYNELLRA